MFRAIHEGDPTPDLLAVKYIEALQGVADGQATKIFLPLDTSGVTGSVAAIGELFRADVPSAVRGGDQAAITSSSS